MTHTRSMIYKPTDESRELFLFTINDGRIYQASIIPAVENLKKKINKGIFDKEKAVDLFYYVATAGSNLYKKYYGYSFDVTARYTAAADMLDYFMEDIEA